MAAREYDTVYLKDSIGTLENCSAAYVFEDSAGAGTFASILAGELERRGIQPPEGLIDVLRRVAEKMKVTQEDRERLKRIRLSLA